MEDPELEILIHKLRHPNWEIRNSAVKALGEKVSDQRVKLLIEILEDKREASWWRTKLGDPFYQVGFIRRNAWIALRQQNLDLIPIEDLMQFALKDPYYEVRSSALLTLLHFLKVRVFLLSEKLKTCLFECVWKERNFEILIASILLTPYALETNEILELSRKVMKIKHWKVREAYLDVLFFLLKNGNVQKDEVSHILQSFNMRSDYFQPVFSLKAKRVELDQWLLKENDL